MPPGGWQGNRARSGNRLSRSRRKHSGVRGSNPYFPLTPGYRLRFRHGKTESTWTVLNEIKLIDTVETRVVEDREAAGGQLAELTRDYFAIDSATGNVYYFGEDVDVYRSGKVAGHEGSWLSGVKGAKFGLMMPGSPRQGQRFYQEQAPGLGMDRAEILSTGEALSTPADPDAPHATHPAGSFTRCVHTVETSALEKGLRDHKWYTPGVGPVKDGEIVLVELPKK